MKKNSLITVIFVLFVLISPLFAQKKKISLAEINNPSSNLITKPVPMVMKWEDNEHYVQNNRFEGTFLVDVKTGQQTKYQHKATYGISSDRKGQLYYNGKDGRKLLVNDTLQRKNPVLSPDSNWVAFTINNNLYALEIATGKQIQYTFDGSKSILNGEASWVYYEEILDHAKSTFWWSPDSKHIAFFRSDESRVPLFPIFDPEGTHGSLEWTAYPQPGDPNPEMKIGIVGVQGGPIVWADFDSKVDQYIGKPYWTPDSRSLWMQWMPRKQNELKIYSVDVLTGKKVEVYTEKQEAWIDWKEDLRFLTNQPAYIIQNDADGWDQLYLYDINGKLKKKITNGKFWDTEIIQIDEAKKTIYFTSNGEISTRKDLYSVKFDGSSLKRLTFGLYNHNVSLSPKAQYFTTRYSNTSTPDRLALVDVKSGKIIREIADSKTDDFDNYEKAQNEIIWTKTSDGFEFPAMVSIPPNIDPTKKYPVIINTYGGPDAPRVVDRWWGTSTWKTYENIIYVVIDHRGSGHCGKKGLNTLYRNLGKNEISDYIEFLTSYLYKLPYVDRSKVAIEGQSYGGYLAALAVTKGADYFHYGIADFGVMDWTLYDTHYTERYMDTPENNPEGYKESSVFSYVKNYRNKNTNMLFIRHGMADDNVHTQNSILLIDMFQNQTKDFEMRFYPGCGHGYLGAKYSSSNNDMYRFYYKYLLNKEVPKELIK